MSYRRAIGTRVWHICRNCSAYPQKNYQDVHQKPKEGEICPECNLKVANKACSRVTQPMTR